MNSVAELLAIKEKTLSELNSGDTRIVVGLATCGIAAGAKPVFKAFEEEVSKLNLKNVKISQAGCLGMCKLEPMVEVFASGKERVTYIKVDAEKAKRIVAEHIAGGSAVEEHVIGAEEK